LLMLWLTIIRIVEFCNEMGVIGVVVFGIMACIVDARKGHRETSVGCLLAGHPKYLHRVLKVFGIISVTVVKSTC
jgi:hypothetical protein